VTAAGRVFAEKGVANTAVSDIVKAAGVAQGTFYLYFKTKEDVLVAVVERTVDRLLDTAEAAVNADGLSAVDRFMALKDALVRVEADAPVELIELLHLPENRALHDRMAEHLLPRFVPLLVSIVEQGVAEGVFTVPDPTAAAWFVLGGLNSVEVSRVPPAEQARALTAASDLAIRALGYPGGGRDHG
jgi:AcrR family transcriptional regulator